MKIENEKIGFSFELPDRLTVRQQLKFKQAMGTGFYARDPDYVGMWQGSLPLISNWKSELVPDPEKLDLDAETNSKVALLVQAVTMAVFSHVHNFESVDPN